MSKEGLGVKDSSLIGSIGGTNDEATADNKMGSWKGPGSWIRTTDA